MNIIIFSIIFGVLFLYSIFITLLFVLTEKQYAKYFVAVEEDMLLTEKQTVETVEGLRSLLRLLREFMKHSFVITKKYDLINHPDFLHFQKQLSSLCYIIERILSNEGGDIDDEENNVSEERRKIS